MKGAVCSPCGFISYEYHLSLTAKLIHGYFYTWTAHWYRIYHSEAQIKFPLILTNDGYSRDKHNNL